MFQFLARPSLERDEKRYGRIQDGFLYFDHLRADPDRHLDFMVSLGLRLRKHPEEPWTARFHQFKQGRSRAVEGACRLFRRHFTSQLYPTGVSLACIIGAEHTHLSPSDSLRPLAETISDARGWDFCSDLLSKRRYKPLGRLRLGDRDRKAQVEGAYTSQRLPSGCVHVVLLDDYCSSGATLAEAARAVRTVNPQVSVSALVLGRSRRGEPELNKHIPWSWSLLWKS